MTQITAADLKVLLVDDHMVIRHQLEGYLKAMGCKHVDQAPSVAEATNKMAATAYNVIFLDWNMPGRSGYNLLQQCRENRDYDNVAFVICSSESENRYVIEALKAGATSYIVKPVPETVFKDNLQKVLTWLERRAETARQQSA